MSNDLTERIEAAGYPVLDFNQHIDEIGLDFSTDFYDYGGHVNALGEGKCTEFLRQYLDSHYELPDRRSVQGYESWDSAWELYQQKQSEAEASCRKDIEEENSGTGGRRLKERRLSRCAELQDFATVRKPGGRIWNG